LTAVVMMMMMVMVMVMLVLILMRVLTLVLMLMLNPVPMLTPGFDRPNAELPSQPPATVTDSDVAP
jgi:hypothetical protein